MEFRTILNPQKKQNSIDYNSNIVLFGSCFTENLDKHLKYYKFNRVSNPYGILFHPKAIEKSIEQCIQKKVYNQHNLYFNDNLWSSFNHHSKFSSDSLSQILSHINGEIDKTHTALLNASHVLITLGTAWVYRFVETEMLVANCHKIPQRKFTKELLSIAEITDSLHRIVSLIKKTNPKAIVLFTVSPVRHVKNGFIENTRSKAHLHTAVQQTVDHKKSFYFPSYEIMMDDLRDYRFYKNDLLHPNKIAMEYIWDIFKNTWINEKSSPLMKTIDGIQKSLKHKPFHVNSERHQLFLKNLEAKIKEVKKQFPSIVFKDKTV